MPTRFLIALALGFSALLGQALAAPSVTEVLPQLTVAAGNVGDFTTPLAYRNGSVYTINVEPALGAPTGINLRTVVRKGVRKGASYTWTATTIDDRTMDDPWHTQGSIAMDKDGYIHAAYNMHNMPWQYSVSKAPEDISAFAFRGEAVSAEALKENKYDNRTNFPFLGQAAIPGTQVTYPAFFTDRKGELYVTYRFALRPKRAWAERDYGAGLARYDTKSRTWTAIGGKVDLSPADADVKSPGAARSVVALCTSQGLWANYTRLWFDKANRMHVAWSWSDYRHFAANKQPEPTVAYAFSSDGHSFQRSDAVPYALPIAFDKSDLVVRGTGYRGVPNIAMGKGDLPLVMLTPPKLPYHYAMRVPGRWQEPAPSPFAAAVIVTDDEGTSWAFASGPTILTTKTPDKANSWKVAHKESTGWGSAKVLYLPKERAFLVHLTKTSNWQQSADPRAPTRGECSIRIIRVNI